MRTGVKEQNNRKLLILLMLLVLVISGCNTTRYLKPGEHLLRRNSISIHSDKVISHKSDLKDNLSRIEAQKPNSYFLGIPFKLLLYNRYYKKHPDQGADYVAKKSREKPVIVDTSLIRKTDLDMKSYLFNQGYFYARVKDTTTFKKKKAFVKYDIDAGANYIINNVKYVADDSAVLKIILDEAGESGLKKDKEFTMSLLDDERSRIASSLRDHGYYRFSQDNINFIDGLDTVNKALFNDAESPFESAINFISKQKSNKKPTVDITCTIKLEDDSLAYRVYTLGKVHIYPDFNDAGDFHDTTMITNNYHEVLFKYHTKYVNEKVVYKHLYLLPGRHFSQSDYDKTISKFNELGIFRYIRIVFHEDSLDKNILNCTILLNRTKKHDFIYNLEVSNGSTYTLGNSMSLTFRDRNIAKGANLLTASLNGGFETIFDNKTGNNFFDHFFILTKFYGIKTSIDFPKFLSPIGAGRFINANTPHTIINLGTDFMDRLNYFTLANTSANLTYNWRETQSKTWDLSPAFINIIRLPYESDSFKTRLAQYAYLANSYKQNFIEGENISYTISNAEKKKGQNYSFLKISLEEAGALLSGINQVGSSFNDLFKIKYAQYLKLDFDARHYFTRPHSLLAVRFFGGIGHPYGQSDALPYVKQYFVGGPYSLRGWRVRTLGPGSFLDTAKNSNVNFIDQTGDIKLEWNAEYRFFIANMFSGGIKFNGALFFDAGNIWLSKKDNSTPGGEFEFYTLWQDIAADMGAGVRFDIASFFTLRLDFAFPVKKPYIPANSGWVFNQISPYDPNWRANNIIFNLSIGYPF